MFESCRGRCWKPLRGLSSVGLAAQAPSRPKRTWSVEIKIRASAEARLNEQLARYRSSTTLRKTQRIMRPEHDIVLLLDQDGLYATDSSTTGVPDPLVRREGITKQRLAKARHYLVDQLTWQALTRDSARQEIRHPCGVGLPTNQQARRPTRQTRLTGEERILFDLSGSSGRPFPTANDVPRSPRVQC